MKSKTGKLIKKKKAKKILTGIELLTSKGYKASYKNMAETYCKQFIDFKMVFNAGSFTSVNAKGQTLMNIDLNTFRNEKYSTSHYHIFAKGLILHESGHVLYTDFSVIKKNAEKLVELKKMIKSIGSDYYREEDESKKEDIVKQLNEKMNDYVKVSQLPLVLNSFEDAAIERMMSEMGTDENGCICFTRDTVVELDTQSKLKQIYDNVIPLDSDNWNLETLKSIITEARLIATAGYRTDIDITILNHLFDTSEIVDIKDLCKYVRFMSKTTTDRNISSEVFLDMCKPIIDKIANDLTELYITNIDKAEERMESMKKAAEESACSTGDSCSIPSKADGGFGLPSSGPKRNTGMDLELPDELTKKLEEKAEEMSEKLSEDDSKGEEDTEEKDSSKSKGKSKDELSEEEDTEEKESSKSKGKTENELSDEAIADITETLDKAAKTFEKYEDRKTEEQIEGDDIRAGEGRSHKNIKASIADIQDITLEKTDEGEEALNRIKNENLSLYVNELSKKIKKVLMRKGMDDTSRGRYEGDIDFTNLHRIKTDCQMFKKDIEGTKNKVRFAILVDESGSMGGKKIVNAILGCWMIVKAAQKLKIPFAVYGHDEDYSNEEFRLRRYIPFEKCKKLSSIDELFKMEARENNRDGLAIFHTCRELVTSSIGDEDLYFIILSDGAPAASGYGGEEAFQDMRETINTFKKHYNVHSIGIGIGDFNFENIGIIYDNHVCVKDVKELPNEMFKIFKKILKVEK